MTIDMDRFKGFHRQNVLNPYIAIVFGTHNRDGLFESIISYNKYYELAKSKPYRLILIGNYEVLSDKDKITKYIQENNLQENIEIKGLVRADEVPQILINADCLLTTPSEYISGGFPTKLGEYMLSGVPVVLTIAGEVGDYTTNMENVLSSQPGNWDEVAANILYVQENRKESLIIAENAKLLANQVFNANNYIVDLISFITKIKNEVS